MKRIRTAGLKKKIKNYKTAAQFINPGVCLSPDKKVDERELTRLLRMGLAAEEEATHLYEFIADATDNELVKKVCQDIAKEERDHKGEFQKLLNILLPDEEDLLEEGSKEVEEIEEK